jgi:hypothetical protein
MGGTWKNFIDSIHSGMTFAEYKQIIMESTEPHPPCLWCRQSAFYKCQTDSERRCMAFVDYAINGRFGFSKIAKFNEHGNRVLT